MNNSKMKKVNVMENQASDLRRALTELIESLPSDICIPPSVASTLIKWSIQIKGVTHGKRYNCNNDQYRRRSAVSVSGNGARLPE
jgi:hypothetical protein